MRKPIIWTPTVRRALFERITAQFGPYATWGQDSMPGNGKNREFLEFCDNFARTFGMNSGEAVVLTVQFCNPPRKGADWSGGIARNAILNLAAAFEAGFITNAQFPTELLAGHAGKSKKEAA